MQMQGDLGLSLRVVTCLGIDSDTPPVLGMETTWASWKPSEVACPSLLGTTWLDVFLGVSILLRLPTSRAQGQQYEQGPLPDPLFDGVSFGSRRRRQQRRAVAAAPERRVRRARRVHHVRTIFGSTQCTVEHRTRQHSSCVGRIALGDCVNPNAALLTLKSPLLKRERDGSTLLHLFAGGENCEELIVYLLQNGIPVDTPDNSGWTPLLEAAQEGQIRNCDVLLAHGATPDLAAAEGMTPLMAAAKVGNAEMTKWLLRQPGTWSRQWDDAFFALLLHKTPSAALEYLDVFAQVQNHSKLGNMAVKYRDLRLIYGEPHVSVEQTALGLAVSCPNGKHVLPHRVMRHLMKTKWASFAKTMFRREFTVYCTLVASYYIPTIWADPDWVQLASKFDYWVACCRAVSWACSLHLLLNVEYKELTGNSGPSGATSGAAKAYFRSFWNWLNFTSYFATMITIPFEFIASQAEVRDCLLALITVTLWVNMLQFLQVTKHSGLLLAMMSRMRKDVYRFFILYSVFLLGFSGAFYLLLRGKMGFESFRSAFLTVLLMLFGDLNYDTFSATQGWTWHMCNALLFTYLLSAVIVLLNILIAMMATTYSDIWDAAEAETMLCHAQAIIRMEKALGARGREHTYNKLLGRVDKTAAGASNDDAPKVAIQVDDRQNSTTQGLLRAHFHEKKAMISSIVEKMKNMPKQAVENALATSPTWSAVKPIVVSQAANFHAPNLDALKESLYLKSAFDADASGVDGDSSVDGGRRELGLLEDGIRYEMPLKAQGEPKSQQELILELQTQVQQLTAYVKELGGTGIGSASSSSSGAPPSRRRKSLVRYASPTAPAEWV